MEEQKYNPDRDRAITQSHLWFEEVRFTIRSLLITAALCYLLGEGGVMLVVTLANHWLQHAH